ncbi:hypothetical protein [Natronoglycomyces albus]|uniref:Uncharacterized protein n=1 Tax=Natronoglycomyces albus TaxID=2811108 RepID=A0A895XKQ8_9ACTN|nr:hypothetical protein [Natronoglycomyces albus]QSB06311.1 hypothetical protein JQS30_05220 [Natronoglycomyces albus]
MDEVHDLFARMMRRTLEGQWVLARYEHRVRRSYLRTVVAPSMGSAAAALEHPARSAVPDQNGPEYDYYREELQTAADGRWCLRRGSDSSQTRHAFDGRTLVSVMDDGSVLRSDAPAPAGPGVDPDWNCAPATSWTSQAGMDFRLMLEPALVPGIAQPLAAPTEGDVAGTVVFPVRVRNVDLFNCSLLSPWAQSWELSVEADTALVVRATAFDEANQVVVEHVITHYETGPDVVQERDFAAG